MSSDSEEEPSSENTPFILSPEEVLMEKVEENVSESPDLDEKINIEVINNLVLPTELDQMFEVII